MNTIQQLLELTLETEGILRILTIREDNDVKLLLSKKYRLFGELMAQMPDNTGSTCVCGTSGETEEITPATGDKVEPGADTVNAESGTNPVADCTQPTPSRPPVNLMKVFTLNDKFRFRRELFHGNESDFIETLNILSEMNSYKEAQEYLLSDMAWEKDDENVICFLSILAENMPA